MVRKSISSSSSGGTAESSNTAPSTPAKPTAATPNPPTPAEPLANPLSPQVTATSATAGAPLAKAPTLRLAKTLTWRSNKSAAEKKPKPPKKTPQPPKKILHPSERPLTETNLKHQELLNAFAMNFGRRRASQGGGRTSFVSNVSPMGSRQASMDGGPRRASHSQHGHSHLGPMGGDRRFSSLAREGHEGVPPDVEEEGSQTSS
jgi:hypothetical protein